ncbi:glycoside hydrolase family 31 protein [Marinimicrobium alkaliphilum]|uniref:glycoside hydrolase family 31 protein n=1 Tax=Marinimicrobium alkaliphilum TaxID=2202654 RepID=UPI000DBA59EC|nr:TIM-barrel domain-containing protein [Marinimicrobium alkaliphilum]
MGCSGVLKWLVAALAFYAPLVFGHSYQSHQVLDDALVIDTDRGQLTLRFHHPAVVEAFYQTDGVKQLPSFTLPEDSRALSAQLSEADNRLHFGTDELTVKVQKRPLRLSYYRDGRRLVGEEAGLFQHETLRGFRFDLTDDEKLLGGGQRVLGMDRRGHRLPLYNQAHYGYSTESEQMYFSIPGVISSNNYALVFDNSATGVMDLGATEKNVLQFEAVAGRTGYIVAAGEHLPDIVDNYVSASGKPPLPPRWALGSFASRFGYRSEQEVRDTVKAYRDLAIPLDALVIDLFWFGEDIQGHMGNLAWDKKHWPDPEKMLSDLRADGVKTILITEPFVLTTSKRWDEAVREDVLAKNFGGKPKTFDFYFGNTGIIDVFDPKAKAWFWNIYKELTDQGIAGWWGDLGEPEVHPSDTLHAIGTADEIHNAYGHEWARLVYEGWRADYPETRPFIMMRAGSTGSQRYGMIPWTGDVERSWAGLEPQVELALQMSLFGFGYIHSDLGGFAGGEQFDPELYIRWLQYGVFQPVYRPHAQEEIAPEPVFHDGLTQDIAREYINLRYRLLPYNYTLAYRHSMDGTPLMRPLIYAEPDNLKLLDERNSYLWGDAFLVAPVTERGVREWPVRLPEGVWFDYWSGERYEGDRELKVAVDMRMIPVLVKAGSFIPKAPLTQSLDHYTGEKLELHYYADASVSRATGELFDDDGESYDSLHVGDYEHLQFVAEQSETALTISLSREGDYSGRPHSREITLVVHHAPKGFEQVLLDGEPLDAEYVNHDRASGHWDVRFEWSGAEAELEFR